MNIRTHVVRIFSVTMGLFLVGYALWIASITRDAASLRGELESNVTVLSTLTGMQRSVSALETPLGWNADEWAELRRQWGTLSRMYDHGGADLEIAGRPEVDLLSRLLQQERVEPARLAASISDVIGLHRAKAATISERLSVTWQQLMLISYVAIGLSLVLASSTSVMLLLLKKLQSLNMKLETLAHYDILTGIANRPFFNDMYVTEWRRCYRDKRPLAVLMMDVDEFKKLNDAYGHPVGDTCLRTIGQLLRKNMRRAGDFAGRYGGEEFVVLLPDTNMDGAMAVAERIRCDVERASLRHARTARRDHVTVSIGCATTNPSTANPDFELLTQADEALYEAKHAGRNTVRAASAVDTSPRSTEADEAEQPGHPVSDRIS